jgi:hypothetical protein
MVARACETFNVDATGAAGTVFAGAKALQQAVIWTHFGTIT